MGQRIRLLTIFLVVCFGLLFVQLSNLQVRQASSLQANPADPHRVVASWQQVPRGDIYAGNGLLLARSVHTPRGYQRSYPDGPLYAPITGYYDATEESATGLEEEYDGDLVRHESTATDLRELITEGSTMDSVVTTIAPTVQKVAQQALSGFRGAVVAIRPQTGAVVAMYSNPTFDPNRLALLDKKASTAYYNSLDPSSYSSPLVNGVTQFAIAPGSTFKVITTAAVFDHDPSVAGIDWPDESVISLPQTTKTLQNYAGESCGGALPEALAVSCDTAYAQIGMKLGATSLAAEAEAFGFNRVPPIDLPGANAAFFPAASTFVNNQPFTAYSAIGQQNDTETPLQDALVAAAIANGGTIMVPHLMQRIVSTTGEVVASYQPKVWRKATSVSTADQVRTLMLGVVTGGTASGVFPPALDVAAKTGTAETGALGCSADWMIAFGPADTGQTPQIAVAAVLPAQAGISCSETGAEAAGPIVEKVLAAAGG